MMRTACRRCLGSLPVVNPAMLRAGVRCRVPVSLRMTSTAAAPAAQGTDEGLQAEKDETATVKKHRLSALISSTGLTSRREAEKWIGARRVTVGGKVANSPSYTVREEDIRTIMVDGIPLKQQYGKLADRPRIWAVQKMKMELVADEDPKGRVLITDRLRNIAMKSPYQEYGSLKPLYRLDYLTEGLLLMTNSGPLAQLLNGAQLKLPLHFRVRIHGLVTDSKLFALQRGLVVDGVKHMPMEVSVVSQSHTITWLNLSTADRRPKVIEKALEHLKLKAYRIVCTGFGPYKLDDIFPEAAPANASVELKLAANLHAEFHKQQNQHHSNVATITAGSRS